MDLLKGNIKKIYFKYLAASFGSAMIVAVYSIVDAAMVGQYEGPNGVAALATVLPIWSIIYSLGMLFGIGGAVLMASARGRGEKELGDRLYSGALIGVSITTIITWSLINIFLPQLLTFFGADATLLVLAERYMVSVRIAIPLFMFGQFLAAFLRNDNAPVKATAAVVSAGIFNMVGDYFFVFVCDMGIFGAGLATSLGQLLGVCILMSHFFSKKCTLKLTGKLSLLTDTKDIIITGFSTFFIDIALGILSIMFNNQIMKYAGTDALAIYGVIININVLVQSCAYGIGQAAQPIISVNYGAGNKERVKEIFKWCMISVVFVSVLWTVVTMVFPMGVTRIFMEPNEEVLKIAPPILRTYFISFLLLPFNIFSTYYFQAVLKHGESFLISVLRGMVISGLLIYLLPLIVGGNLLWTAMPLTEVVILILVIYFMKRNK